MLFLFECGIMLFTKQNITGVIIYNEIDKVEMDYVIKNGVKLKIVERDTPLYKAEYCNEVDIWYVSPRMPSGKLEDGTFVETLYKWPAFILVRGNDSKIVGCRF